MIRSRAPLNLLVVLFVPLNLRLAATRQNVAEDLVDLQTWQLAMNLRASAFKALPFACSTFADIATDDLERQFPGVS